MMIFLVFSHYQRATDAFYYRRYLARYYQRCPRQVNNLLYDLFTLAELLPLMWWSCCDHRYLLREDPARSAIVLFGSIAPGKRLGNKLKARLGCLNKMKRIKGGLQE